MKLQLPNELLTCKIDPIVPEAATQADVALYIANLWEAGEDCRSRLQRVKEIYLDYLNTVEE